MSKEYREREEAREATLKEGSQLTHKKGLAKTPKPKIKPAPQKAQSVKLMGASTYKALKHKETGEWGKLIDRGGEFQIITEIAPTKIPTLFGDVTEEGNGLLVWAKGVLDYELVTVELREVGEVDEGKLAADLYHLLGREHENRGPDWHVLWKSEAKKIIELLKEQNLI